MPAYSYTFVQYFVYTYCRLQYEYRYIRVPSVCTRTAIETELYGTSTVRRTGRVVLYSVVSVESGTN